MTLSEISINVGILLGYLAGNYIYFLTLSRSSLTNDVFGEGFVFGGLNNDVSWRLISALGLIAPIIMLGFGPCPSF